jgi:hypothetical protein
VEGACCVLMFKGGGGGERSVAVLWGCRWGVVVVCVSLRVVVVGAHCMLWFKGGGGGCSVVVLSMEGSTLTERTKTTNDDEYHCCSLTGCHITDSNVGPGVSTFLHLPIYSCHCLLLFMIVAVCCFMMSICCPGCCQ